MVILVGECLEELLVLDEARELQRADMPISYGLLGVHGEEFQIAFALLSLGRLHVDVGDEVAILLDVSLHSDPGLGHLVVSVMVGEIEESIFKIDTPIQLHEGMNVLASILMLLLGDDVLHDGVLLPKVLQDGLRWHLAPGVG